MNLGSLMTPLVSPLIIDGGMATSLEAKGVRMHPTLWSGGAVIDAPEMIAKVHSEFAQAGANFLTSASYQLTPQALRSLGYNSQEIRNLLLRTVELAKRACLSRSRTVIAGGIGPYGAYLCDGSEYRGHYAIDRDALVDFHRERYEILANSKCDIILFETVPCLEELYAIERLAQIETPLTIWVSLCCRNENELSSGEPLAEAARILDPIKKIQAIGVNCVAPQYVASHLRILKDETSKDRFACPNRGQTWDAEKREWHGHADNATFLKYVDEWIELDAIAIGGCCGVGCDLIRAICEQVVRLQR